MKPVLYLERVSFWPFSKGPVADALCGVEGGPTLVTSLGFWWDEMQKVTTRPSSWQLLDCYEQAVTYPLLFTTGLRHMIQGVDGYLLKRVIPS